MGTNLDINTYIERAKTTLIRLRLLLYLNEETTISKYLQEMEYVPYLIDNIEEAISTVASMLDSSINTRKEKAVKFIYNIREDCTLIKHDPDPQHRLLYFYNRWQELYCVLPDKIIPPAPTPKLSRVVNDIQQAIDLKNKEIDRLWGALSGQYIQGEKADFVALYNNTEPSATLTNITRLCQSKQDNATMVDLLVYLGYPKEKQAIRDALKTYFGYSARDATQAINPQKYKPINDTTPAHVNRRSLRKLFKH